MTAQAGTADRELEVARSFIGVVEHPFGSNRQRFSEDLGRPPEAWCADYLADVSRIAGVELPSDSAATWVMLDGFRKAGRAGSRPSRAAFVFFRWPGEPRATSHVGLVEAIFGDGSIGTIEGNTDVAGGGSGGRVMRQRRRAFIVGYGYPRYVTPAGKPTPHPHHPAKRRTIELGDHGHDVALAQRLLNRRGAHPELTVDGAFGPKTDAAVRAYQAHHGLTVDGIVGRHTWAHLQARR